MPPHRSESRELEEVEAKKEVVEEKEKENGVEIAPRVSLIVASYIFSSGHDETEELDTKDKAGQ